MSELTAARLLDVDAVIAGPISDCYQFAVGHGPGGPYRRDSRYLELATFELIEPPFDELPGGYIRHGVTRVAPDAVGTLAAALKGFAAQVRGSEGPGTVYGSRSAFKPALAGWPTWTEARVAIAALAGELQTWVSQPLIVSSGLTIIRQ